MTSSAFGYYLQPSVWIAESLPPSSDDLDLNAFSDVVFAQTSPRGVKYKVRREGLFIFDVPHELLSKSKDNDGRDALQAAAKRCASQAMFLNCHLMCLYSALCDPTIHRSFERMIVDSSNLIRFAADDSSGSAISHATNQLLCSKYPLTYHPGLPTHMDWRNLTRNSILITPNRVASSFTLFESILEHKNATRIIALADLLARAAKELQAMNCEISLNFSWMICESSMEQIWERYVNDRACELVGDETVQVMNAERRQHLTGRDYTASIQCEILSLAKEISFTEYQRLTNARRARNSWIHNLKSVPLKVALDACLLAQSLIKRTEGIEFIVPPHLNLKM